MFFKKNKKPEIIKRDLNELSNKELCEVYDRSSIIDPVGQLEAQAVLEILQNRRNDLHKLYQLAYSELESGLYDKAFTHLTEHLRLIIQYGEVENTSTYLLMIAAVEGWGGLYRDTDLLLQVYDNAISYYSSLGMKDEIDLFEKRKADCLVEVKRIEDLRGKYEFSIDCADIVEALDHLSSIIVGKIREPVYDSFDSVWWSVYRELEYFNSEDERNRLNKTTSKGARTWLKRWAKLCKEAVPDVG